MATNHCEGYWLLRRSISAPSFHPPTLSLDQLDVAVVSGFSSESFNALGGTHLRA